jgi:hypothetical protein
MIYFDFNNANFNIGDKISYNKVVYTMVSIGLTNKNRINLDGGRNAWLSYRNIFTTDLIKEDFCNSFKLSRA